MFDETLNRIVNPQNPQTQKAPMSEPPIIPEMQTSRLVLRGLRESDALGLHAAYGDPETMRYWDAPPTRDIAETTGRVRQSVETSPQWHTAFAAILRESGEFVGMVNYHARYPPSRRLAVGWILAPQWLHHGLAQEAALALIEHCFIGLDAHRIEARIEPDNLASLRLADRLGFRCEGLLRDWLVVDGKARDVFMYALLQPEWANSQQEARQLRESR